MKIQQVFCKATACSEVLSLSNESRHSQAEPAKHFLLRSESFDVISAEGDKSYFLYYYFLWWGETRST
jgi:hypothetical protein